AEEKLEQFARGTVETGPPAKGSTDTPLGALSRAILWTPGTTLHVRFLDGAVALRERVKSVAVEWTKYANLRFNFDDSPNAEVRVSFRQAGSWAFQGKDGLNVPRNMPTVNYGYTTA